MKKIYIVAFALMVLFSMTMGTTALESKSIYRQSGTAAYAAWSETTNKGISTDTYLSVTETDDGTDIFMDICTSDKKGDYTCKWGYKFVQEDVLDIDRRLEYAKLNAVDVDLFDWETETVETVTIQAEWTGIGDITKGSFKSMSKNNDIIAKYSDSSTMREATATGSINEQDLGESNFAGLVIFKYASMWMEK